MKRPKVERSVRQAPSIIAHLQKMPLHQLYCMSLVQLWPAQTPVDLKEAEVCTVFQCSQPLELMRAVHWYAPECIAASGTVSCPCCSDDDLSLVRPASNAILLCCYQMLEDIVLVATGTLEVVIMKGMSVYHHLHLRSKLLSCCRGPSLPVPTKVL